MYNCAPVSTCTYVYIHTVHVHTYILCTCRYSYTIITSWPALVAYYEVRHATCNSCCNHPNHCVYYWWCPVFTAPAVLVCCLLLLMVLSTPTGGIGTGRPTCNILCVISIYSKCTCTCTCSFELSSGGEVWMYCTTFLFSRDSHSSWECGCVHW